MPNQPHLLLVFFLTYFTTLVNSQTTWTENFSDSNFTANPAWQGATTHFTINGLKQLWLNAPPVTANSSLATPSTAAINAVWQFYVEMDFNPSSSNFAQVFFMSSSTNSAQTNGYFVQIGGSTDDKISLYKSQGNQKTLIAESQSAILNTANVKVRVKVERDSLQTWSLFADTLGGSNFILLGAGVDSTFTNSNFFMLNCVYTSTRSNKFFVDDILVNGQVFIDNQKPKISSHAFVDARHLQLTFSENVDSASATKLSNYQLGGITNAISAVEWTSAEPETIVLQFQNPVLNTQSFSLFIEAVEDAFGNEMNDTTFTLAYFKHTYRGLVFSEIMADPSPTVGQPNAEYVEIYNATAYPANLAGWHFLAGADDFILPNYELAAHSFVLLVSVEFDSLFAAVPHISIAASSSYLNNGGENLSLLDDKNELIDGLNYATDWQNNPAKRDGGWSLEIIDGLLKCYDTQNWCSTASISGGTPGKWNQPEIQFNTRNNQVLALEWVKSTEIILRFLHGMAPVHPPKISSTATLDSVFYEYEQPEEVHILFSLPVGAQPVTLFLEETTSCNGLFLADTLTFSAPQTAEAGDVVLNEILFNPARQMEDFVELWNVSQKTIRLGNLRLANVDENGNVTNQFVLGAENALLLPGAFLLISPAIASLCANYACAKSRIYSETATPSMPDADGNIALTDAGLTVFESVNYSEKWQHPSITNAEGVSLERIHPTLKSIEANSWHSAASTVNYATPGKTNSQFNGNAAGQGSISVQSSTISPNNDGQNDVLFIDYNLPESAVLSIQVFGINGVQFATIADQMLTETSGELTWNGIDENGQLAASGIYILLANWFTPSGEKGMQKLNIVVSR